MIVEGLVTSCDSRGTPNVAPIGPIVVGSFQSLTLRPFEGSTTFENLKQSRCGVFHVVDEISIIAAAAIGDLVEFPETTKAIVIPGHVLRDCCRWFEFQIVEADFREPRSVMQAEIVHVGERRPFFGFNRARHAVIELAILATRVHLLTADYVSTAVKFLRPAVEKTGGPAERESFQMLEEFISQHYRKDHVRD